MLSRPTGPPAAQPPSAGLLPPEEFRHWYGRWEPLDPTSIAAFMEGFDRPWWIIGGWSIEVVTGVCRPHEDMDISILSGDAEAFRLFLGDRWTPWNVDEGWFRPFDDRFTEVRPDSQLWVRRDAGSPWVLDVPSRPRPTAAGPVNASSSTPSVSTMAPGSRRTGCAIPGRR